MNLFYKKLIEAFKKEEVKDQYRTKGIRPIQFIDLYAGQEYNPEAFEIHNFPALLINWSIDYRQELPIATLDFSLLYEQLRDTSNLGKNTDEALKFIDFISITDNILKTIETPHTGKLKIATEGNKLDDTVVDVYNLSYQCSYSGKLPEPQTGYLKGRIENLTTRQGLYAKLED